MTITHNPNPNADFDASLRTVYAFNDDGLRRFRDGVLRLSARASLDAEIARRCAVLGLAVGWQPYLVLEVLEAVTSHWLMSGGNAERVWLVFRLLASIETSGGATDAIRKGLRTCLVDVGRYLSPAAAGDHLRLILDGLTSDYGGLGLVEAERVAHVLVVKSAGVSPAWGPRVAGVFYSAARAEVAAAGYSTPFVARYILAIRFPAAELPADTLRDLVEAVLTANKENA